jgi:hypothetical protein
MPQYREDGELYEALIRLDPAGSEGIESIMQTIEDTGGRILMSYPPFVVVALCPIQAIKRLRDAPSSYRIDTDEISEDTLEAVPDIVRIAVRAWNDHLKAKTTPQEQPLRGLPWDALGLLPPDPPPEIQERLRRREQEIHT